MTVGAWILYVCLAIVIFAFLGFSGYEIGDSMGAIVGAFVALLICIVMFGGFSWYYSNTAAGARALKTQESNFNLGINRRVTVYDVEGDIIKTYEGKFDVTYDNDRILFDDEKGLRHIIYYPTGTVTIDEVGE